MQINIPTNVKYAFSKSNTVAGIVIFTLLYIALGFAATKGWVETIDKEWLYLAMTLVGGKELAGKIGEGLKGMKGTPAA